MKTISGDLIALALAGEFDVIIHGCNCQCKMGAGIALQIKRMFPEAYAADQKTPRGDRIKLGTITFATVQREGHELAIVNAYTQFDYKGRKQYADYKAIRGAFKAVRKEFTGKRIGYPRIGAGLAGGDWGKIAAIIDEELQAENHTLVEFAGP